MYFSSRFRFLLVIFLVCDPVWGGQPRTSEEWYVSRIIIVFKDGSFGGEYLDICVLWQCRLELLASLVIFIPLFAFSSFPCHVDFSRRLWGVSLKIFFVDRRSPQGKTFLLSLTPSTKQQLTF